MLERRNVELPLALTNFIRFNEARLQAVSSKNMYSEQVLLALIRAVFFAVVPTVHRRVVLHSGSPQCQVESEIFIIKSRAPQLFNSACPSITFFVHNPVSTTAR